MFSEKQLISHALQQLIFVARRLGTPLKYNVHHLLLEYGCYGSQILYMYQFICLNQIR